MKRQRTMAYTHAEFKRLLPFALRGYDYVDRGDVIEARRGDNTVRIHLGEQYERRIAALSMPVCDVTLELSGFGEAAAHSFLEHFDRTYRRGGG